MTKLKAAATPKDNKPLHDKDTIADYYENLRMEIDHRLNLKQDFKYR